MPNPSKGEDKDHFISRCIPIVIREGTTKDTSQAAAICYSIWERKKKNAKYPLDENLEFTPDELKYWLKVLNSERNGFRSELEMTMESGEPKSQQIVMQAIDNYSKLGNIMIISGTLLEEGTWTGMDGEPTFYPANVICENSGSIIGKPIKGIHKDRDIDVVGFWTSQKCEDGKLQVAGVIFNEEEMLYIESGKGGLSAEIGVITQQTADRTEPTAVKILYSAGAVVENPACKPCRVESAKRVALENKEMEEKRKMSAEQGATNDELFGTVEQTLKEKGIPDEIVAKMVAVLKGGEKPEVKPPATPPATITAPGTPAAPVESTTGTVEAMSEALKRNSTDPAFKRHLRNKLREAGLDKATRGTILKVLGETVEQPIPYNLSNDKELDFVHDEVVDGLEKEIDKLSTEAETKEQKLKDLEEKLNKIKEDDDKRKLAEVATLVASIKDIDETFDNEKFLEGITCVDIQKNVLTKHLEMVKKLQPAIQLSGVNDVSSDEEKLKKAALEMFGTVDIDSLIKAKEED